MTYNRFRDVAMWLWALKDSVFKSIRPSPAPSPANAIGDGTAGDTPEQQAECFESEELKQEALQRVRSRVRVLMVLASLFLFLVLRDTYRRWRDFDADAVWMKVADGLLNKTPQPKEIVPANANPGGR